VIGQNSIANLSLFGLEVTYLRVNKKSLVRLNSIESVISFALLSFLINNIYDPEKQIFTLASDASQVISGALGY